MISLSEFCMPCPATMIFPRRDERGSSWAPCSRRQISRDQIIYRTILCHTGKHQRPKKEKTSPYLNSKHVHGTNLLTSVSQICKSKSKETGVPGPRDIFPEPCSILAKDYSKRDRRSFYPYCTPKTRFRGSEAIRHPNNTDDTFRSSSSIQITRFGRPKLQIFFALCFSATCGSCRSSNAATAS